MAVKTIFFDTEFTALAPDAKLVSIGMVDGEGQREFYAELIDTYTEADCSEFCRAVVLPLLQGGNTQMTLVELRKQLVEWLSTAGANSVLICDSTRDLMQIDALFPNGLPENCRVQVLGALGNWKRRIYNLRHRIHKKHSLRAHHALDDAQADRIILAK